MILKTEKRAFYYELQKIADLQNLILEKGAKQRLKKGITISTLK